MIKYPRLIKIMRQPKKSWNQKMSWKENIK